MSSKLKAGTEIQGITRLITDGTLAITDLVEAMHQQIIYPPFLPSTPFQHAISKIAGFTYKSVRGSTKLIGGGIDKVLELISPFLKDIERTDDRENVVSVLNGILGDYLEANENPLKIPMQFRHQSSTINLDRNDLKDLPNINGKILVMVHGSCMNDIQWTRMEHNHGTALSKDLNKTVVYLKYNSGRHISSNGQDFNDLLETLVKNWPVPVEELNILAFSMGGLVSRSAMYYGLQQNKSWTKRAKKIVFLGTPHHGAALERVGNYIDVILGSIPYAKPFARLAKIRSAGVTDLRYGNLIDEDWQDQNRFHILGDQRHAIPLPKEIHCYSIAAVIGETKSEVSSRIAGDKLVDIKSALGHHKDPNKNLNFKEENTWVSNGSSHLDLLSEPNVYLKIKSWLE